MRKEIKDKILNSKIRTEEYILKIMDSKSSITYNEFFEMFKKYIASKLFLEIEEIVVDNFYEICQLSVDKVVNLPPGTIDASALASKCGGATDAMNKKILFIIAVKRELGIDITPEESVQLDTLQQIAMLVYRKVKEEAL
jgi:hypothetical protein